jgi:hypothetical protein
MIREKEQISAKWRLAYIAVIGALLILIIFFYLFTEHFS